MPAAVGEEIRPAGAAIALQSGWERSLKGRGFPDDHLIGGVELAGAGNDDAMAGGGNGRNCCNRLIPAPPWPEVGRGWSVMNLRCTAEPVMGRLMAVDGGRRRTKRGGDRDQNDDFGR